MLVVADLILTVLYNKCPQAALAHLVAG